MVKEARSPGRIRSAWEGALRKVGIEQRSTLVSHLGGIAEITNGIFEAGLINPQQTLTQLEGYIHQSTSTEENKITSMLPIDFLRYIRPEVNWTARKSHRLREFGTPLVASNESQNWKTQLTVNGRSLFSIQAEKKATEEQDPFKVTYEYSRTVGPINWRNYLINDLNFYLGRPYKSDRYIDETVRFKFEGAGDNKAEYALLLRDGDPQVLVERHRGDRRNTGVHYFETYTKRHPVLTFFGLDDISRAERILTERPGRRGI